jgi:ABC-type transport system involved in multi-copper enzyme maturation permease subunit
MTRLPTLPLLTKELTEQSARRRTFVVRALYALLLYGFALAFYHQRAGGWAGSSFAMLGTGQQLFAGVLLFQFVAVYALLPMLMAGVLTSEKERDTLGLLLITKLGPWTIVLEKFLSRAIPMLYYLLLSLPLLGVAYSLGGVQTGAVLLAGVALTLCVLQVGSVAVLCSAWFRTTSQALIGTYLLLVVLYVGSRLPFGVPLDSLVPQQARSRSVMGIVRGGRQQMVRISVPTTMDEPRIAIGSPWLIGFQNAAPGGAAPPVPSLVWASCGVVLATVLVNLFLARLVLWPRAFLKPQNRGLRLLQFIDRFMHRMNQNRFTQGRILIREQSALPLDQPIAWRETSRRSFGTVRYLVRLLLAIELPLLFWLLVPLSFETWHASQRPPGQIEQWVVWWLGTLLLIAQSTGLVAGERSRQTLDVLLSTPLSPEQIVRQKFAGLWRLMFVLAIPFATAVCIRLWWSGVAAGQWREQTPDQYLTLSLLAVLVYWPLIAFLGYECGLRCRTQLQAMTVTLCAVLSVTAVPLAYRWVDPRPSLWWREWSDRLDPLIPFGTAFWQPDLRYRRGGVASIEEYSAALWTHAAIYLIVVVLLWWQAPREFARVVRRCEEPLPGDLLGSSQPLAEE